MLKKRNLSDLAYEEIVDRIIRGIFKAGEILQEEKLSAEFEISRTPVREALKKLSSEGFIEQLSRGFRVAILNRDALKELFGSSSVCEKAGIAGTPVQSSQNPA